MKKTITVTLIISLVMCLFMAFPASAAQVFPEINDRIAYINEFIQMSLNEMPSNYKYCFVFSYLPLTDSRAQDTYVLFASDKPILDVDSKFYFTHAVIGVDGITEYVSYLYRGVSTGRYLDSPTITGKPFVKYGYKNGSPSINEALEIHGIYTQFSTLTLINMVEHNAQAVSKGGDMYWVIAPEIKISALQILLTQAKTTQNTGYTQSSWQSLQTQITNAETLLATTGYTQAQVDNAKNALQAALDGLQVLPDTSGLDALFADAEAIEDIGYTAQSWSRLQAAISSVRALLSSTDYTQSELNAVTDELQASIANLVTLPDTSFLRDLLVQSQAYVDERYTEISLQILNSKIVKAFALLDSKEYVASQIDNMILELLQAINGLVFKENPDPPPLVVEGAHMWELNNEQKKYTNLINGVKPNHLEPVKESVEDNIGVARGYGLWVWVLVIIPIIIVIVARGFLRDMGSNVSLDMTHRDTGHIRLTAKKINRRGDDIL